jgi:hypothetical protein
MNLSFLDDLFKGIGNVGADADQFMKREMPFDSGWAFPAAVAGGAYFGLPAFMGGLGEGAAGIGATEGAGAAGGGAEMFTGFKSFLDPNIIMNATEGAEGSIGSGGMNSLLSSLGLGSNGGAFAGQEAFSLPNSAYTPEYLDSLAKYQGVDAGNASYLDRLMGNTEQGLYKQEGLAKQASGQTVTDLLKKQAQQKALSQLGQSGSKMQEQNTAQQAEQNKMAQLQAMMRRGQGVDTTTALLSLLQDKGQQSKQPRISLI